MVRILIVEDHESMRESLNMAFSRAEGFEIAGEVSNADYAAIYCEHIRPDLVFMDVCTEGGASGLAAAEEIRKKHPNIKIIIMTAFDEISYIPRAKEIGANGFIYKSSSLKSFVEIAADIMDGKASFPEPKTIPMPKGEVPLTEREMEVLRLMCKHNSNKDIAETLFISESTVKYHKANMLAKTGFSKAVDLAFYVISNGWINPLY